MWWKVTTTGRFNTRLTTPLRSRAFLMRRTLRPEGLPIMATTRDELSATLHKLSNYVETRLCELLPDLLAEGRTQAVTDLAWAGCRFVDSLREIRDGKEGGGE